MKWLAKVILFTVIVITTAIASNDILVYREYELKAVYLFNFLKYTTWPPSKSVAHYNICVIGTDPFGAILDTIAAEKIDDIPITITRFAQLNSSISKCHILFISQSESTNLSSILNSIKNSSVLTVSDSNDFIDHGGMVSLVKKQNKIAIEVNLTTIRNENIDISSRVLALATIVE
jgi:hypothetical protein